MPTQSYAKALIELRDRLQAHPLYERLTEAEELATGGDTAEFSYLVRVADEALRDPQIESDK
jgi:hypothetical protein